MEKPKKLADVMSRDLAGFQLVKAYFLELEHTLMGFFPAITKKDKEMVVCLNKSLLEKVWNLLLRRSAKVVEVILLVNVHGGCFGFDIRNENKENTKSVHILLEEEFLSLTEKSEESPFEWASGLFGVGTTGPVSSPFT